MDIRPEVAAFAQAMELKLRENEHKGGWKNCDIFYLFSRLAEETAELKHAVIDRYPKTSVLDEAADVANFAMMIADVCGALLDKPEAK